MKTKMIYNPKSINLERFIDFVRCNSLIKLFILLFSYCLLQLPTYTYSQGVGINPTGTIADPSAMLDVSSTDKGVLISRMSTAQRDAISSPAQGLLIYNTTTQCFEFYDNSSWYSLGCTCTVPDITIATAGTGATATQITANWNATTGATSYSLDVSTVSNFSSFVAGYNDLDVGAVTTYDVTGLTCNTTYYYRIRAVNACGTTGSSNTISYTSAICFSICGASTYNDVTNPATGKVWLDRNLGASQVSTAYDDYLAYGSLFQWGRLSDGHECITWTNSTTGTPDNGTTAILSAIDNPGHGNFVLTPSSPYDWRNPQNNSLWQGAGGINNPCPMGYRLPTEAELDEERLSWSTNDVAGAFASPLKLPTAGSRSNDGSFGNVGFRGYYWSSTIDMVSYSRSLNVSGSNAVMVSTSRGVGYLVRCIKN